MIDPKTQLTLNRIGRQVDDERKKTSKYVNEMAGEKAQLEWTLKKLESGGTDGGDLNTNRKAAKAIRSMLASGEYDKTREQIDEAHLDRIWTAKLRKAARHGAVKLPDISKDKLFKKHDRNSRG